MKKELYALNIQWQYIFFQIICTFIKLIFVFFASVEIPVRDKMGCWNEVSRLVMETSKVSC